MGVLVWHVYLPLSHLLVLLKMARWLCLCIVADTG
jgi:hypothetical protein